MTSRHGPQGKARRRAPAAPLFENLEPRLLLSADVAAVLVDPATHDDASTVALAPESAVRAADLAGAEQSTLEREAAVHHELVFIDVRAPDHERLVDDVRSSADPGRQLDVILLEAERDGIAQISEALAGRKDVSAVHIISHGQAGRVELGSAHLEFDTLLKNASDIQRWGNALKADADILIYGCDLAADEPGRGLVKALSRLTGADVAASDDATGQENLGGDWQLEHRVGEIETRVAFSARAQEHWHGTLAAPVANDDNGGSYSSEVMALSPDAYWRLGESNVGLPQSTRPAITTAPTTDPRSGAQAPS